MLPIEDIRGSSYGEKASKEYNSCRRTLSVRPFVKHVVGDKEDAGLSHVMPESLKA